MSARIQGIAVATFATPVLSDMEAGIVKQESTKARPRDLGKIRAELRKRAELNARLAGEQAAVVASKPETVQDIDCPLCGAIAGHRCVTGTGGRSRQFHKARQDAFDAL